MLRCDATLNENYSPLAKGAARSDSGRAAPGGCPFGCTNLSRQPP